MSRQGKKYPPKKKHANKPRATPIVPLSDVQRKIKAQQEFEKAIIHLIEAERIAAWGGAPNACLHSAYYAMHHCAAAAILAAGGVGKRRDAPQSHEHVIEHYGNLIRRLWPRPRHCQRGGSHYRQRRAAVPRGLQGEMGV